MKDQPSPRSQPAPPDVLPPARSREQVARSYDRLSRFYWRLAGRFERKCIDAAVELLQVRPGERALEIGFGPGYALERLARSAGPRGTACGIDLSPGMVRAAKRRLAGLPEAPGLALADALYLPFRAWSFDAVLMSFTLELFEAPEMALVLEGVERVLKPGGRLVVAGMSLREGRPRMLRACEWAHRRWPDHVDCRPIEVEKAVAAAAVGFKVKECRMLKVAGIPVEVVLAATKGPQERLDTKAVLKTLFSWVRSQYEGKPADLQGAFGGSTFIVQPPPSAAPPPDSKAG